MATLIPALSQCLPRMQSGEKRVARRLEEKLEDDYLLWYDVAIGQTGHHPDFIVLNPRRGILVLEVKDWKRDTIHRIDKNRVTLITGDGPKEVANPFEQARLYAQDIVSLLQKDASLALPEGPHRGRLAVPWSYGVVFSNLTRAQFDEAQLHEVIPAQRVLCKDEITESVDPEAFQQRLWGMFPWVPSRPLTLPQIDRIRWHIFPELRIGGAQLGLFEEPDAAAALPDLIRIMDLQQEQLARSLGEGHRVIHGVAGSGKTMILGYRCLQLAKVLRRPILVLCYNRALTDWLEAYLAARGISRQQVNVSTFHAWCREQLKTFHVGLPREGTSDYFEQLIQRVILAADRGLIPRGQYGAVLIDEGHDFQPEWLKLVAQMVAPETNSLLVLYDDAQSIYRRGRFSFRSVGIHAQGRTTILRLNYRNTSEILQFAYHYAKDVLTPEDADEDGVPLLLPQSAGRHGPPPQVIALPNLSVELRYISGHLQQLRSEGLRWSDMAVLYRTVDVGAAAIHQLRQSGIPSQWVGTRAPQSPLRPTEDSVKVITFHSSKGLEFPVIAIPGVGRPSRRPTDAKEEARLLYVAMTRAVDRLVLTGTPDALRVTLPSHRLSP
ncbi:NERD domain-containing protein [Myxococcus sp. K38C18041901]|uniref:DEAD/DEAH box helicase n=1 Tax=Myxococcus guangdongensis TaxID=2906760 RepID=UPI0020A6E593|nr:3'-5' exonuclease [Myxococcus guangdongensis]MCP3064880.1 NERD domain-containing protein [Myxococcus guangdongensis]